MKSQAKALLAVAECLLKDTLAWCIAEDSYERDLKTLRSRVEKEGESFLTITLPTLGSDLETALENKVISADLFRSFKKRLKIPAFLQGLFCRIFDMNTGGLLDEPSIEAIAEVRQIAYAFKKVKIQCSPERFRRAMEKFVHDETIFNVDLNPCDTKRFIEVSNILWGNIFGHLDFNPYDFIPKHGPGATAEKLTGNAKYAFKRWHERLEPYFPFYGFARPLGMVESSDQVKHKSAIELESVTFVNPSEEQPVRVIGVPKTLKTPRIIAIEPVCMQYSQQAVAACIVKTLQSALPTKGHINFTDQSVNQRLALRSSMDNVYATIDLSAASDRVPLSLAMRMFDTHPELQGAIYACRSKRALVSVGSNRKTVNLQKFASMGSALCFPVEAMYFYTICIVALLESRGLPVNFRSICKVGREVYVYGDDIIVPTHEAMRVTDTLEKYYLKVNTSKSFWNGKFRESCGVDAYDGTDVTPVYIRQTCPMSLDDVPQLLSWVATSNLLHKKGYWFTAQHLMSRCQAILGTLPVVSHNCGGLGKVAHFQPAVSIRRWGFRYQRPEVRTWTPRPVYYKDRLNGYPALAKCLLRLLHQDEDTVYGNDVFDVAAVDKKHLERSPRYGAVALKRRWISPF